MAGKNTAPDSLYGNSRDILREAERENEILAELAGETYESPGEIPKGKYVIDKRMLDAAQKKNELLESIAEGGGSNMAIGIDYATDVISLKKNGETIQGSGATLPVYGLSYDTSTGGLTLTKNGTAAQGQTVALPDYGSPLTASSTSDMTDTDRVYVNTTDGKWYYYDGDSWEIGGTYNSQGIDTDTTLLVSGAPADAKATGNAVSELKTQINKIAEVVPDVVSVNRVLFLNNDQPFNGVLKSVAQQTVKVCGQNILDTSVVSDGTIKNDSGTDVADYNSRYYVNMIPVIPNERLYINFGLQRIYDYDANKSWLRRSDASNQTTVYGEFTVPSDTYYIQVQFNRIDSINLDEAQINRGSVGLNYAAYSETEYTATASGVEANFPALSTVWSDGSAFDIVTMNGIRPTEEFKTATVKDVTDTLDSLVSIVGSASFTAEGAIVTLQSELVPRIKALAVDDVVTYYGENIFDSSTRVEGKIKNDSGAEIEDRNSNYYSRYIPVSDKTIKANFDIQRTYLYDSSKGFISRTPAYAKGSQISFAPNVKFVQIQVEVSKITDSMCIIYGDGDTTYKAFWESTVLITRPGEDMNIVGDGVTSISVDVEALGVKAVIPAVKAYPMWEPTTATDAYKCTPLGQNSQSIPALTDTLGYIGFLETYFDIYLGEYSDGYSVTREDLGLDSGAEATGNIASPIYSYVFAPKNYNKTVLLSAGMNTCEASTFFGVAYFIKALMEHTEDGMDALYNSTRFVVMPVICPSGIAHDPLLYPNSNNVRINKNFEYYGSWERLKSEMGGAYPDSEVETKALKYWLNKYAGSAFWLDCHSDTANGTIMKHLGTIFCSDSVTASRLNASRQEVIDFYIDKGYITAADNAILGFSAQLKATAIYPKTVYGLEVTRIPSAMMEQFEYSTAWGSNGNTNNDQYAIKHYVAMIRYMVLIMCQDDQKIIFD